MKIKMIIFTVILVFVFAQVNAFAVEDNPEVKAVGKDVVCLGADLTDVQKQQMYDFFGADKNSVKTVTVTIDEIRVMLEGLSPNKTDNSNTSNSKSISSAYIKILDKDTGINVNINNITSVTKEMYSNAMVTAGIKNAQVTVAAPFKVTGTAALTGIMKAFEDVTGNKLSEDAKKTASKELVVSGEIGNKIGNENAANLIKRVKEEIIKQKATTPEDIKKIIITISVQLNIKLTTEQVDKLVVLMVQISKLDLNVDNITKQLGNINDTVNKKIEENKGLLQSIQDLFSSLIGWIKSLF